MDTDRKALIFNAFGILASIAILLSGAIFSPTMIYLLVQLFGLLLIVSAMLTIKVGKRTHKLPKGYFFIKKGPYEIIRHPIYAGYLLIMISIVEIEFNLVRLIALVILCIAVFMKILREEYTMTQDVHEYREYKEKTKAIIPYLL